MKISYNWLKEFVDIKVSPEKLAEDLSLFGQEVDSVEKVGDDYILDFEITPNRGDCLSILGMAREIAALYGAKIKDQILDAKISESTLDKAIQVKIEDPEICPRFTALIIDGIKIGESPEWMQEKLASYGFRPVNNIVDITNYVMVAQGQPLHAFDYDKIKNGQMFIRKAKKGEEVMTLDGKNHHLPLGAIVICDEENIYDLAGIMGGYKSEVDEKTKTIILVGSIFDPVLIRKTSKFLNHTTDASYRYERGVDFEGTTVGVNFAAKLILDECKNAKVSELIDSWTPACNKFFDGGIVARPDWLCKEILVEPQKVNYLLGTEISDNEMKSFLEKLNFKVEIISDKIRVSAPSYRDYDIKIWQDVAEEIARMKGYNNLGTRKMAAASSSNKNKKFIKKEKIKDILSQLGFTEVSSYPFIDKKQANISGINLTELQEIEKPLSPETQYLRNSLDSSLFSAISRNPWAPDVNIFEIGKVFEKTNEKWQIGIAVAGKNDQLLKRAITDLQINADIKKIDQKILDFYKIRKPVSIVIYDFDKIGDIEGDYAQRYSKNKYRKVSAFAPTVRDVAFIVDAKIDSEKIINEIKNISDNILLVELFDEFTSEKFGQNKKNIAYHIWLQDLEKPMQDVKVEEIIRSIINKISKDFNATLRS